ncbi:cadmium-translocating P-type ATPase [Alloprevotella rava F0323]|uniref:P-type Zn(2+) transporter n=1 Tax=Alloprevotella rava F0323 TaxID=679199 RepID=G5GAV4_9BACT|nr:heavy metal translocating P-type ATPase [Alloprevotella rava]EHG23422.1 cadmium-translocating P-type ATPase [Alloprevotella rava F0323]
MYSHNKLFRIIVAALLLVVAVLIVHNLELPVWQQLLIFLVPYLVAGYDVLGEALEGIMEREPFNENLLMSIATLGALFIGFLPGAATEFPEAVFVMLFFQVGELFEHYAEDRSRKSIAELMDIRPDVAHVEREGEVQTIAPTSVSVGEIIEVRPGERVPMDGCILEGETALDTIALTGESVPRMAHPGDSIISGSVNLTGVLKVRVEKTFGESTASKIIDLVENAGEHKSKSETFIARFAKVYTPIVVYVAIALALLPPLFAENFATAFPVWLNRALTFLVVSCPCALVISIPLTFFGGIGGASRRGILIKGSNYMDALSKVDTVVFDKTGTLTRGVFKVTAIHPEECDEEQLLHLAAHVERFSTHPIAVSLREAYSHEQDGCTVEQVEEVSGQGVRAVVNGKTVCVGNTKMMEQLQVRFHPCELVGTIVHVAVDGEYFGHIVISDEMKSDAREAVAALKAAGVRRTVMLTGDRREVGEDVAKQLGLDEVHTELLPAEKVERVEALLEAKADGQSLIFVGDGMNDAPVLARADVGMAMGGLGSDAAIEAADVVIMDDKPSKVALAIALARRTVGIAMQNAWFAIGVKVLVLFLAAFGIATMWMAVFADVGVMVLAVLNAMRALKS